MGWGGRPWRISSLRAHVGNPLPTSVPVRIALEVGPHSHFDLALSNADVCYIPVSSTFA